MAIEQLVNKGLHIIHEDKIQDNHSAIIVIGSARSGTSIVAGALHHLGVFTGDSSYAPVFEDLKLSHAFEQGNTDLVNKISCDYSKRYALWAFKRPGAIDYFDSLKSTCPNALYIFTFKDLFSIAKRNEISMGMPIIDGLERALSDYQKIIHIVKHLDRPAILVSSEKLLQNKDAFVDMLIDLNKNIIDLSKNRAKALKFIEPNPTDYIDQTRITKAKGAIGIFTEKVIQGWCFLRHQQRPVKVELYVDGKLIQVKEANEYREHLNNNKGVKSAYHGFSFDITEIKKPCEIEVKAQGDVMPIKNGYKYFN